MAYCNDPNMSPTPEGEFLMCTLDAGHPSPVHEDQSNGYTWTDVTTPERTS